MKKLISDTHIKIEIYNSFKKMSFQNRYLIYGANNLINLTIPVAGGREQKTLFRDVKIDSSENWRIKHWRALTSAYRKAPFFEFYSLGVKELLFSREEYLFLFNYNILEWICKILKIKASLDLTEANVQEYRDGEDFRNYFLPKSFQLNTLNWSPRYEQVFQDRAGFQPNLSILDLIFCQGPNAINLLNNSAY